MVSREMIQRANNGPNAFVVIEESEHANKDRLLRKRVELRKSAACCLVQHVLGFSGRQEGERMIGYALEAVEVTRIRQVAPVMNNHADRLLSLSVTYCFCYAG